jgi:hypothetical protein
VIKILLSKNFVIPEFAGIKPSQVILHSVAWFKQRKGGEKTLYDYS